MTGTQSRGLIRGSGGSALLSEDQTSHSLIWSGLGELSSEVMETTEDGWYQSDWAMNGSTVFAGNTKPERTRASELKNLAIPKCD